MADLLAELKQRKPVNLLADLQQQQAQQQIQSEVPTDENLAIPAPGRPELLERTLPPWLVREVRDTDQPPAVAGFAAWHKHRFPRTEATQEDPARHTDRDIHFSVSP